MYHGWEQRYEEIMGASVDGPHELGEMNESG